VTGSGSGLIGLRRRLLSPALTAAVYPAGHRPSQACYADATRSLVYVNGNILARLRALAAEGSLTGRRDHRRKASR
jgi:hypothetical protein